MPVRIVVRSTGEHQRLAFTTASIAAAASRQPCRLAAIENEEPFAGKGQVPAGQLGERHALALQRLNQAHTFDLIGGEFTAPAAVSSWSGGLKQTAFDPVFDLSWSESGGFAKLLCGHRNRSYNAAANGYLRKTSCSSFFRPGEDRP